MILTFRQFVNEKFILQPDDEVNVSIDKKYLNEMEDFIKTWNNNKQKIKNFFVSKEREFEQEQTEVIDFFFKKGWIEKKTKDFKQLRFRAQYSLLNDWCRLCKLNMELEDLEAIIKGNKSDIENAKQNSEENTGQKVKQDSQNKIDQSTNKIAANKDELAYKIKERNNLDKQIKKDFELLVKKVNGKRRKIEREEKMEKSAPAETEAEGTQEIPEAK